MHVPLRCTEQGDCEVLTHPAPRLKLWDDALKDVPLVGPAPEGSSVGIQNSNSRILGLDIGEELSYSPSVNGTVTLFSQALDRMNRTYFAHLKCSLVSI